MLRNIKTLFLILIGAIIGLAMAKFISDNQSGFKINFWLWETKEKYSIWQIAGFGFLAGMVVPCFFILKLIIDQKLIERRWRKRIVLLETELHSLRNLPLKEELLNPKKSEIKSNDISETDFIEHNDSDIDDSTKLTL